MKKLFFSLVLGTIIAICWVMIIHTLKWIAIRGNEFELLNQQQQQHHRSSSLAASAQALQSAAGLTNPVDASSSSLLSSAAIFAASSSPPSSSSSSSSLSSAQASLDATRANTGLLVLSPPGPTLEQVVTSTERNNFPETSYSELRNSPALNQPLLSTNRKVRELDEANGGEKKKRKLQQEEEETETGTNRKESEIVVGQENIGKNDKGQDDGGGDEVEKISAQKIRLKRQLTAGKNTDLITGRGRNGAKNDSSKSEVDSSSSSEQVALLNAPGQHGKTSNVALNRRQQRSKEQVSTNVAAQRVVNLQQRQQQEQQQHRTGTNNNNNNQERQLYQKRLMHLSSIVPQPQPQQQHRNRNLPGTDSFTTTPPMVMDTSYEDSLKSEANNGNSAPSSSSFEENQDNLDLGQASNSWPRQADDSQISPQLNMLNGQQIGPTSNQIDSDVMERGAPVQAGLVYRAPFFTSWFVSIWNILFMPVFTLISSCCFRNEDNTTKKLLV